MKICPNCRQTNPPEAMFCRQCASSLGGAQQQQQYANPQPQFGQQQQWNQPNYGNQQVQNFGQNAGGGASSRATTALILGLLTPLCCGIFTGIPAAILGWLEISAIKEGKAPAAGMTYAQIGLWGGIIGIIVNIAINLIFFLLSAMAG